MTGATGSPGADVVVVGGGLVGSALSYELACRGVSVALIEGSQPGAATDAGAGIVSPETFAESDRQWFRFGHEAADHLQELMERLADEGAGPEVGAYDRCGSLVVALAEHEDRWFAEVLELATARDPSVREVSAEEARAMFPPLGPLWRALHSPSAARVDGRLLNAALRTAAVRRGVRIVGGNASALERRGERVRGVEVAGTEIACDAVVVAAGAWSAELVADLGETVAVAPTKGQIVHVVLPPAPAVGVDAGLKGAAVDASSRWPIVQPVLNFYLVPWPGGRVACGGTFESEAGFDIRPTAGGVRDLLRECLTIAPGLAQASFLEARVGLRPTSADDRPLLGQLPGILNVYVCTGHGAHGLLLGPYSAALVAAALTGATPATLAAYSPARFATAT